MIDEYPGCCGYNSNSKVIVVMDSKWSSKSSDYVFIKRLGAKTTSHVHLKFYGGNGAVYLANRRNMSTSTLTPSSPSTVLPSHEFVIKIVYNYDNSLATRDLSAKFESEMKLCKCWSVNAQTFASHEMIANK
jgi:hypothetical protein